MFDQVLANFSVLFFKISPYYLVILFGFLVGRYTRMSQRWLARFLVYILAPAVIALGILKTRLSFSDLALPALFFCLCSVVSLSIFRLTRQMLTREDRAVISYSCGSGNTGYFGFPLVVAMLGIENLGLAVLCAFGFIFYENTVGYYLLARGKYSPFKSLVRLLKLPSFYAFVSAVSLNLFLDFNFVGHSVALQILDITRFFYSIIGMMIIGFGLSQIKELKIDRFQTTLAFVNKFVIWPLLVFALTFLDRLFFQAFSTPQKMVMILMSLVPFPANSVAFALDLGLPIQKVAAIVFLTTLFALFYIPLVVGCINYFHL